MDYKENKNARCSNIATNVKGHGKKPNQMRRVSRVPEQAEICWHALQCALPNDNTKYCKPRKYEASKEYFNIISGINYQNKYIYIYIYILNIKYFIYFDHYTFTL